MTTLNLSRGISKNEEYEAFVFPGGEVHFKLTRPVAFFKPLEFSKKCQIISKVSNSDELMLLMITIDTIRKDYDGYLEVLLPYMPYQQADRDFGLGECFSLNTVCKLLNTLKVNKWFIFDAHSDVSPAILKNCKVIDNSEYIKQVLGDIMLGYEFQGPLTENLCILSPDAGAYKKIGKLCSKIEWEGELVAANKYRSISTGNIESLELSKEDFGGKDCLIVDDICIGGRTFVELAKKLKEKNCGKLYLAISHGIFSNGFDELNQYFEKIYTTDSRTKFTPEFIQAAGKQLEKINIIKVCGDSKL